VRREHDFYPTTHAGATEGLLALAPFAITGTVLECCSGQHHMTTVLRESGRFSRVYTNDLVPSLEADFHEDARDERVWREVFPEVDWIVTNPTFTGALPIVKNARKYARIGCAFYLRITFFEPTIKGHDPSRHRGPFLRDFPPNGFLPMSRISHTEDGSTDSATCAWFVWHRPMPGVPEQWHRVLILEDPSDEPLEQRNLFAQDPSH
jgi:hypothetical protein